MGHLRDTLDRDGFGDDSLPPVLAPAGDTLRDSPAAPTGGDLAPDAAHLSAAGLRDVLSAAGWPPELWEQAASVAWCESSFRPGTRNGIYTGLFQLSPIWYAYAGEFESDWADPGTNARTAWATYNYDLIHGQAPWHQWECKP